MLVVCINIFNFSYFLLFRSHIKSKHKKFKIRRSTIDVQFRCSTPRWQHFNQTNQTKKSNKYDDKLFIVFSAWSNVVLLSTRLRTGIYKTLGVKHVCSFLSLLFLSELVWSEAWNSRHEKKLKIEIQELHCVHTRENCFKFCTPTHSTPVQV